MRRLAPARGILAAVLAAPAAFADCRTAQRTLEIAPGVHAGAWPEGFTPLALKAKEVVLTFDDGPDPDSTPRILDVLRANCIKASFFPVGPNAAGRPHLIKRELAEGHTIGGHTWGHAPLPDLKLAEATEDIDRGFQPLRAAGAPVKLFRFPQLVASAELLAWLSQQGIAAISADVDPSDAAGDPLEETFARFKVRLREKGGGIVLLHDSQPNTANLLPGLIGFLEGEGYTIVHIKPAAQARVGG